MKDHAMTKGIEINSVTKSFGAVTVLHDINLQIENGEFVILVGPSGCGKSTLLRLVSGLELTSGGQIVLDGTDITNMAIKERDIAMVFQNYALYPSMTVRENMGFGLRIRKYSKDEIASRTDSALKTLGLDELKDRYPRELSGGQRQRVAMGRAIVREPRAFLFDEPLSNLDAKLRVQMRREIKTLQARLGVTTLYVTHDQTEAMTMGDKVVVMNDGRIEQVGAPLDLYDNPRNMYVAGFIGSPAINFAPVEYDGAKKRVNWAGTGKLIMDLPGNPGADIVAGIRPEDISFSSAPDAIPAKVIGFETLGADTLFFLEIAGAEVRVLVQDRSLYDVGEPVGVSVKTDRVTLFDNSTGERLTE